MTIEQPAPQPAPILTCPDCDTTHDTEIALMFCCNDAALASIRHAR